MAVRPGLGLRTRQKLSLTPEIRQGMALLSMPTLALADELRRLADENPFLLLEDPQPTGQGGTERSAFDIARDTVAEPQSLGAALRQQLAAMTLEDPVRQAAEAVTWALDERGYLDSDLTQLAEVTGLPQTVLQDGLHAVQRCDPAGVGAEDLRDCVRLQLIRLGLDEAAAGRAVGVLKDIADGHLTAAAQATGLTKADLKWVAQRLPDLSVVPAAAYAAAATPILPDLVLTFDAAGQAHLAETRAGPVVRLDGDLRQRLRNTAQDSPNLTQLARDGERLVGALRFRSKTLLRVGHAIVAHQLGFLDPTRMAEMLPLRRADIAADLSMHPSTIGRAVADKYISTPRGTFALASFFPARLGPGPQSAHAVQARLAQMIAAEGVDSVLSDETLAQRLQLEGVDIARRTVAKYRGCLGIAPSHIRKRRKALRRGDGPSGRSE